MSMVYNTKGTLYFSVLWQGWGETVEHLHIYASLCNNSPRFCTHAVYGQKSRFASLTENRFSPESVCLTK